MSYLEDEGTLVHVARPGGPGGGVLGPVRHPGVGGQRRGRSPGGRRPRKELDEQQQEGDGESVAHVTDVLSELYGVG